MMTYVTARSNLVSDALEKLLKWKKLSENVQGDKRFIFFKHSDPRGRLLLPLGYIHVYNHYYQNYLLQNRLAIQNQIIRGASSGLRDECWFNISGPHEQIGHHDNIWVVMAIYGRQKLLKTFFSRTKRTVTIKTRK